MCNCCYFQQNFLTHLSLFTFQLLERALEEYDNDIDAAIKSLRDLCLRSAEENSDAAENPDAAVEKEGIVYFSKAVNHLHLSYCFLYLFQLNKHHVTIYSLDSITWHEI